MIATTILGDFGFPRSGKIFFRSAGFAMLVAGLLFA